MFEVNKNLIYLSINYDEYKHIFYDSWLARPEFSVSSQLCPQFSAAAKMLSISLGIMGIENNETQDPAQNSVSLLDTSCRPHHQQEIQVQQTGQNQLNQRRTRRVREMCWRSHS